MSSAMYMQKVMCSRGCGKDVIGAVCKADEEFTSKQIDDFDAALAKLGWTHVDGFWRCSDDCVPFPDLSIFKRGHLPKGYKIKTINPDYYGKVDITNL